MVAKEEAGEVVTIPGTRLHEHLLEMQMSHYPGIMTRIIMSDNAKRQRDRKETMTIFVLNAKWPSHQSGGVDRQVPKRILLIFTATYRSLCNACGLRFSKLNKLQPRNDFSPSTKNVLDFPKSQYGIHTTAEVSMDPSSILDM